MFVIISAEYFVRNNCLESVINIVVIGRISVQFVLRY